MRVTRLLGALILATCPAALAQAPAPLQKSDLVRLLANPLIERREVAAVVRRNCLAFLPTERDWSDLRRLEADADILDGIGACAARRAQRSAPSATLAAGALIAMVLTPRVAALAGARTPLTVQVRRANGAPASGAALALRAVPQVADGPPADETTVADDSGFATLDVAVGRLAGRYRLELVGRAGAVLPGRPAVDLVVSPGPPAVAKVQPPRLEFGPGGDSVLTASVTVEDSLGNAVPRERIELRPASPAIGLPTDSATTDALGRAQFVIRGALVHHSGQLEVRARAATVASLDAVVPGPEAVGPTELQAALTGTVARGPARTRLADALTFTLRTRSGSPVPGKRVSFGASNAQVEPESAVTDSVGQVQLSVRLGWKAGMALVTAVVDSLRTQDTLRVEPGAATYLALSREDQRVDGGRIVVELDVPFSLTLGAWDGYGNPSATRSLAPQLQALRGAYNSRPDRLIDFRAVQAQGSAIALTFLPLRLGTTDLRIAVGDLSTSVSVTVVPRGR